MIRTVITVVILCISFAAIAQDYQSKFLELMEKGEDSEIISLLEGWAQTHPADAEMFIAYFNFYLNKSRKEIIRMGDQPGQGDYLVLTDTTTQEPAGYMFSEIHYDDSLFALAHQYLTEGIAKNPKRLDMYFGRIYSLREKGFLSEHVAEILKVIEMHKPGESDWKWSNNEAVPDPEVMFKGSIQDYNYALFNLEDPYTEGIQKISEKMMRLYPNDVENYSNLGVCNLFNERFPEALKFFQKAHAINPKDALVLGNIAHTHMLMRNNGEAIRYYRRMIKFGNEEHRQFARLRIEQLENEKSSR